MLKQESLVSLFSLLQEMTFVKRGNDVFRSPRWINRLGITMAVCYFLLLISLEIFMHFKDVYSPPVILLCLGLFSWAIPLSAFGCMISVVIKEFVFFWTHRKNIFSVQFSRLEMDMLADVGFMDQLRCYERSYLEYALMKYRNSFHMLDVRTSLIIGDLRKIGLFPGFIVLVVAASTLIKNNNSMYFWAPLILSAIFYFAGIFVRGRQERAEQVIDLLDYAILHSEVVTEQK
ncbi:hypothetical protein [Xanthomonas albilineans]|uniref:hypothetical protein n=1 Tax=Xanthomonas albilineans TaxID=29447 RepID=UPI0012D4B14A|nr:hypothetical protein [Xanthomonas albilineans]